VDATDGALAIGAGWDKGLGEYDRAAIRFQVDYIWPVSSGLGDGWRYSVGFAYRFPFEHQDKPGKQ
jgi:hypothetical protein